MSTSVINVSLSLSLRTRYSLRDNFTNISSQKLMDSDSAFASYSSNTRYLTNALDGSEMSSGLELVIELVKPYTVELRVRISLTASMPFTLNGVEVTSTSWANLVISILDIKMGTTGMDCLYPFPYVKDTAQENWLRSSIMDQLCISSWNGAPLTVTTTESINTRSQRPISRS